MAKWAQYADGQPVSENVFRLLAKHAPGGTLDVFASDQHGSYLKLIQSYLKHIGETREATNEDVTAVCRLFAKALGGNASAALFNNLAFMSRGFRRVLGEQTMLIGRLEDSFTDKVDDGAGELAKLTVEPKKVAGRVDAFKTLVKLNVYHKDSWNRNRDWLAGVWEKCQALDMPLFNETILLQKPGEPKLDYARRLPEGVAKMAEDFGPYGTFYKTQVPVLWTEDKGVTHLISTPDEIRSAAVTMYSSVDRPMLLLSAAVDFEQYAAQYALVSDLFAGPMCGRAYFKEAFTMPETKGLATLGKSFTKIALPRIAQIKSLANKVSKPWWHKFTWMSDEAKAMVQASGKPLGASVKADFGY